MSLGTAFLISFLAAEVPEQPCHIATADPTESYHAQVALRFGDLDGLRVSAMLVRACVFSGVPSACNEGMYILQRRWSDKSFREGIIPGAGTTEEVAGCFERLRRELDPTDDFEEVRKVVRKFHVDRRSPDSRPSTPPAPPRAPRGDDGGGPTPPSVPWCLQESGRRCIR